MFFYQPSLIGLFMMILAFLEGQFDKYGSVTAEMVCFVAFWWVYLFTHYIKEEFMLSTWDITDEHFGFMLVWGDMVYVPFLYSIVGWFITDQASQYTLVQLTFIVVIHIFSHFVFRTSNWQKFAYKKL